MIPKYTTHQHTSNCVGTKKVLYKTHAQKQKQTNKQIHGYQKDNIRRNSNAILSCRFESHHHRHHHQKTKKLKGLKNNKTTTTTQQQQQKTYKVPPKKRSKIMTKHEQTGKRFALVQVNRATTTKVQQ